LQAGLACADDGEALHEDRPNRYIPIP